MFKKLKKLWNYLQWLEEQRIEIDFNWNSGESLFLIPTIEISKKLRCNSILWLKWSLDYNY
jgi:hypothetical protein